jgi:phosphoribosylformylglycinamidine cyclo-ligase
MKDAKTTYKNAGVDVAAGDEFVENIKQKVSKTFGLHQKRIVEGIGGFAALFDMGDGRYLAAGTDGVGTKLKLAFELQRHDTIGIDLVAMCVNDVACTGATPLFFLDYLAQAKLDLKISNQIIDGIIAGCVEAGCALIGGETAEMPGMYAAGEYDLAGFCVGEVKKNQLLNGQNIKVGDQLIGLASTGFHSNGFSLIRKLVDEDEVELKESLLTPTRIYVKAIQKLQNLLGEQLKGVAHITGGGWDNIERMNHRFQYPISYRPDFSQLPEMFEIIAHRSQLSEEELYQTFNMGVGLVVAVDASVKIDSLKKLFDYPLWKIGEVSSAAI